MRLVAILIILWTSTVFAQAKAVIKGPTEKVAPGDLVILDATESNGDSYQWMQLEGKQCLAVERSTKLVFSTGQPGLYRFILAVSKGAVADDKPTSTVATALFVVQVGDTPIPPPEPPAPGPDGPDPPKPPDLLGTSLEAWKAASRLDPSVRGAAVKMAGIFEGTAGRAAGLSLTPLQMVQEVDKEIASTLTATERSGWSSWGTWFKGYLPTLNLSTREQHVEAWKDIATGLKEVR